MRIEVIKVVEFDQAKERERLENVFKGEQRTLLLSILDRFESGLFEELAQDCKSWPKETAEYLHPVVFDVIVEVRRRQLRAELSKSAPAPAASVNERERSLNDLAGLPTGGLDTKYPQYRVHTQPSGEVVFHNPNDIRVQHGYALHVLASTTHGLLKSCRMLESTAVALGENEDGSVVRDRIDEFLGSQAALLKSAALYQEQLGF